MGTAIEMKDVYGNTVRVYAEDAVRAVADTLLDDESLLVARTKEPVRYFKLGMIDDSEVPG